MVDVVQYKYTSATGSSAERNGVHYSIVTAYAL